MDYMRAAERLMTMDDEVWMRHANPWSAYTRVATAPFLFLALWSHVWIGWWSIVPIVLVSAWIWYNPRAFSKPASTKNWASQGVFGERVFLNRKEIPIPQHHVTFAHLLNGVAFGFMVMAIYGFVVGEIWPAATGFFAAVLLKVWFVDRMVWLYQDMQNATAEYKSWLY